MLREGDVERRFVATWGWAGIAGPDGINLHGIGESYQYTNAAHASNVTSQSRALLLGMGGLICGAPLQIPTAFLHYLVRQATGLHDCISISAMRFWHFLCARFRHLIISPNSSSRAHPLKSGIVYLLVYIYIYKRFLQTKNSPGPNSRWYLNESLEKSLIFFQWR
jgi:hypothetical protein